MSSFERNLGQDFPVELDAGNFRSIAGAPGRAVGNRLCPEPGYQVKK